MADATYFPGFALVIGVDGPADLDTKASGSAHARNIAQVLLDPGACRYDPDRVIALTGQDATGARIVNALQTIAKLTDPGQSWFIFIASPGVYPDDGGFGFLSADTSGKTTTIPLSVVAEIIRSKSDRRTLLAIATPYIIGRPSVSSAMVANGPGTNAPRAVFENLVHTTGCIVLSSIAGDEVISDQEGESRFGTPRFTSSLMRALAGGMSEKGMGLLGAFSVCEAVMEDNSSLYGRSDPKKDRSLTVLAEALDFPISFFRGDVTTQFEPKQTPPKGAKILRLEPAPNQTPTGTGTGKTRQNARPAEKGTGNSVSRKKANALTTGTGAGGLRRGTSAGEGVSTPTGAGDGKPATWTQADLVRLRLTLTSFFSQEELELLSSDLEIDFQSLRRDTLPVLAIDLIRYCQSRGRLDALESAVQRARPGRFRRDDAAKTPSRAALSDALSKLFTLAELETLAFDLGVNIGDVSGTTRAEKARGLIQWAEKNSRLAELTAAILAARPQAFGDPDPKGGYPLTDPYASNSPGDTVTAAIQTAPTIGPDESNHDASPSAASPSAVNVPALQRVLVTYFASGELGSLWEKFAGGTSSLKPPDGSDKLAANLVFSARAPEALRALDQEVRSLRPSARYELDGALNRAKLARILERLDDTDWQDVHTGANVTQPSDQDLNSYQQAISLIDYLSGRGQLGDLVDALEQIEPDPALNPLSNPNWIKDRAPRESSRSGAGQVPAEPPSIAPEKPVSGPASTSPGPQSGAQSGPRAGQNAGSGAIAQGVGAMAAGAGGIVIGGTNTGNVSTGDQLNAGTVNAGELILGNKTVTNYAVYRALAPALDPEVVKAVTRQVTAIDTHTLDVHIGPTVETLQSEALSPGPAALDPIGRRIYRTVAQLREADGDTDQRRIYEGLLDLPSVSGPQSIQKRLTGDVAYGRTLRRALFNNARLPAAERVTEDKPGASPAAQPTLETGFQWALARSAGPDEFLRVQLRIDNAAPELHGLRWEYLWDDSSLKAIACNPRTPMARVLHVAGLTDIRPARISSGRKMRVLVVAASPDMEDAAITQVDGVDLISLLAIRHEELEAVENALRAHADRIAYETLAFDDQPSLEAIMERLRRAAEDEKNPFHALHLICHGMIVRPDGHSYVILNKLGQPYAEAVSETALAAALKPYVPGLRLIILASCQTALGDSPLTGIGRLLVAEAGAPAVVAMQGLLEFVASQHFAGRLYERLANSGFVDVAVNAARARLYELGNTRPDPKMPVGANQWGLPVLFMRVPDGRLFDIEDAGYRRNVQASPTRAKTYEQMRGEPEPEPVEQPEPAAVASQAVFDDTADRTRRWALIHRALRYRQLPARRTILFLRGLARAAIADLLRDLPPGGPIPPGWAGRIGDGGAVTLGGEVVEGVLGAGRADGSLFWRDPPSVPVALRSLDWRHAQRGFRPDPANDANVVEEKRALGHSGNLIWSEASHTIPSPENLNALRASADPASAFDRLTRGQAADLDDQTASLILHAESPDIWLPYEEELASSALAALDLAGDARYAIGFGGYCALARDLLRDSALGFEDLADVGFFLHRAAAAFDAPTAVLAAPSDLRLPLARVALRAGDIDSELVFREAVLEQAVTALNAGKHVILIGPPGTGKTTLAEDLCRLAHDRNCNRGHALVTATADWTTFDTIGGYMPTGGDGLAFKPGVFLEAIENQRWLIIDEINRADIDKAFGELFTVLSGQPVTLPYRDGARPVRILPPGHPGSAAARDYVIHPNWRIIGTMNVYDKASLFSMSLAFMRRFAFIDVPLPGRGTYLGLIEFLMRRRGLLAGGANLAGAGDNLVRLSRLLDVGPAKDNALMRHRGIGPAIVSDILRYVALRGGSAPAGVAIEHVAEAVSLYLAPQLDGLDQPRIEMVRQFLTGILPPESCPELYARLADMYPHLRLGAGGE